MNQFRIRVEIDELVLHGFDPGDRHAIAEAVERELATLLADFQPTVSRNVAHVDAGVFTLPADAGPGPIGRGIGAQLHRGAVDATH